MDARQDVLIDMTPYLDNSDTLLAAIEETEAEQAAAIERAAALVAAEEADRAEGIRAMIGADLPAGAADRWAAMFATATDEVVEKPAPAVRAEATFVGDVDIDTLKLSPSMRRCLLDLTDHMHPQTYQGLTGRGLIRETPKGITLTALGKQVRAALAA